MSATEEAGGTRPTHNGIRHPHNCPDCERPWEIASQYDRKCVYCGWHLEERRNNGLINFWIVVADYIPILVWITIGVIIVQLTRGGFK